ncbi:MAG: LapA family protein [Myxococcales bacterium]|nr:LapA family protein [Myxococcales bacterium]HIK86211.1 LapA family protein [Myxococcales bacterium]
MKRLLFWLVLVGLFIAALWAGWTFRASNSVPVDLELIWIRIPNVELWWVVLGSMAIGAGLATTSVGFSWLRGHLLNLRYRRAIRKLETELHEMRSLPLSGSRGTAPEPLRLDPADPNLAVAAGKVS